MTFIFESYRLREYFNSLKSFFYSFFNTKKKKKVIFIFGCQRSGTNMLQLLFERDLRTRVYGEYNYLTYPVDYPYNNLKIRWFSLDKIKEDLNKYNTPIIILRALVESQNAKKMLDYFEGSKAIWIYRNYQAVVNSNKNKFPNQSNDIKPIFEVNSDNWRSEGASEKVLKLVKNFYSKDMPREDAAALFWYARNILFYELGLDKNPNVILCKYEELVTSPKEETKRLYDFIGDYKPGQRIFSHIHEKSKDLGQNIILTEEIENLCQDLQNRLDKSYKIKCNPQIEPTDKRTSKFSESEQIVNQ